MDNRRKFTKERLAFPVVYHLTGCSGINQLHGGTSRKFIALNCKHKKRPRKLASFRTPVRMIDTTKIQKLSYGVHILREILRFEGENKATKPNFRRKTALF